jgi:ATP:ADP antiporter, AAA family
VNRLRSLLKIERGEELPALLLFLYLTLVLSAYIVVKAARDALFLNQFSAMTLPYIYIGVAILIGLVVSVYLRVSARVGLTALITYTLVFFIANVLLLWWAARMHWTPLAAVFYVWSSVFGVLVPTQVWTVANQVLDVRQAKRLFPLISTGGILGSVAGGLIAAATVKRVGTYHLLLVLVPLLALCVVLARLLLRRHAHSRTGIHFATSAPAKKGGVAGLWAPLVQSRYLRLIAAMLALSAVVTLVVDFQFKVVVQQSLHSRDQLTAFFGSFYAFLNFLALVLQLLAGSRLAERFGVRVTLFILPTALISGTLLLLAYPLRLWAALFLKGNDQTLRYSIDKATVELLYLPVPQSVKADAKAVIDMMVQRLADGIGGVALVVMTRVFGFGLTGVGLFNLVLISSWLWVAFRTRKEYVAAIRTSISDRSVLPKSALKLVFGDQGSIATLRSMLESKDEEVVLYAMDLAAASGERIPVELTTHSSSRVRAKAMGLVGMTVPQLLDRVRNEKSSAVGAEAMTRASRIACPTQPTSALQSYLEAPELKVRLSALVCLVRQGIDSNSLRKHLSVVAAELGDRSERWKDFLEALSEIRHPAAVELYTQLFNHPAAEVRRQAALSAGRAGQRELVPLLVRSLADPEVNRDARWALQEYGPRILGTLADVMKDPGEDVEVRRSIPRVLAYVPHQASLEILLEGLFDYDAVVADRSLRALSKLRLIDANLRFDGEKISMRIRDECEKTLWFERALALLYPDGGSTDLLAQLLNEKIERGKDNVFRLLALRLPANTVHLSFLALRQQDRLKKANVAEYLDNVLPANLRKWVLALVEPHAEGLKEQQDRRQILEVLLKSAESHVRECTADAVARNHWDEPAGRTVMLGRTEEGFGYG